MSHLVQTGNLTAAPELKTSGAGKRWCEARIIHNDRERSRDGSWRTISTIAYTVRIYGRQAELLVEAAESNGDINILFAGRYTVRTYTRKDGRGEGIAYEVDADDIAITLGQRLDI
ncbi:MAG TPA: single-stranded DNA-binding protein [Microlunatus sp.]|nr:single-stranded DNA-binding protein [Microlunatus sp.]